MPTKLSLDTDNPTLVQLFAIVDSLRDLPENQLTPDQIALINLKNTLDMKAALKAVGGGAGGGTDCFICATGA